MTKGQYRGYFHIGKIGIKYAKINLLNGNIFCAFLASIIMNLLERKRYKYYVLRKPCQQWLNIWRYTEDYLYLCPTYFSCGLFNIVKHLPYDVDWKDLTSDIVVNDVDERRWNKRTGYLLDEIVPKHFKKDYDGKIYAIDYGYFQVSAFTNVNVCNIDYK